MAPLVQLLNPDALNDPTLHLFSHASIVEGPARIITTAGQVGMDKDGNSPPGFEDQIKLALGNLMIILLDAGATIRNITAMTMYVADYKPNLPIWGAVQEFLTDKDGIHLPPAALIPVPCLATPKWKVEIQLTAAIPYKQW